MLSKPNVRYFPRKVGDEYAVSVDIYEVCAADDDGSSRCLSGVLPLVLSYHLPHYHLLLCNTVMLVYTIGLYVCCDRLRAFSNGENWK